MTTSSTGRTRSGGYAMLLATFVLQAILTGSAMSGSHGWTTPPSTIGGTRRKEGQLQSCVALASSGSGDDVSASTPPFAIIVGNGRIGGALSEAGNCVVLGRGDSIDADGEGPILLATRNDALDEIIENCPENRRKDLVFLQNGYLDDFLEKKGLSQNSQVLLYLSVPSKGVPPTDGVTAFNPEGLTTATGEWAQAFSDRLASINLKCNAVTPKDYRPAMFEKLMWISTYMLVGAANNCATVGDAGKDHSDTVESIVKELVAAVSASEGIEFPDGTLERLKSYTDVVADFPCGVKEFEWRNQYFWNLGDAAVPIHNGLLKECAEKGILAFDLPKSAVE